MEKFFMTIKRIHFVGIGGIGMSGIAEVLHNLGFIVTGSDLQESENTEYLKNLGITIHIGHSPENIGDSEVVVYSSAVNPTTNPETLEAERRGIPILRRAEMLAELTRLSHTLAISGTHGKTTTTSLCGLLLINAGFDPTVIVGGRLRSFGGTNARLGKGDWSVIEADEFDRSFLQLFPTIAIVTNIEPEHLDIYADFEDLKNAFVSFLNRTPFYGAIIAGLDDPGVRNIISRLNRKVITFGISKLADYRADEINFQQNQTTFIAYENHQILGAVKLNIPGLHNVKNALSAIAVGRTLGIDFETIQNSLEQFTGVNRRFEIKLQKDGLVIVDDYAHHPSEIRATLEAARKGWNKKIIAIFQPHTYTRTLHLAKEFGACFDDADVLIVTDVYPAREKPIEGVSGLTIVDSVKSMGHKNVFYIPNMNDIPNFIRENNQDEAMIITIGAGNIWKVAENLVNQFK